MSLGTDPIQTRTDLDVVPRRFYTRTALERLFIKTLWEAPIRSEQQLRVEDYLGFDATRAFRSVGHSTDALTMLDNYIIGILPRNERLYTNKLRY